MAKTKIIATIGPSCESEDRIAQLIRSGVSILRVNKVFKKLGKPPAILLDLQGPVPIVV